MIPVFIVFYVFFISVVLIVLIQKILVFSLFKSFIGNLKKHNDTGVCKASNPHYKRVNTHYSALFGRSGHL